MDFVFPADTRREMKESEIIDKYLDIAWELKRLLSMKVMMIQW